LKERWQAMFRAATSRMPTARQVQVLQDLYSAQHDYFSADPQRADDFLHVGEHPIDTDLAASDVAASAMVASAILSLDESSHKP
jgi:hypothetical protein